MTATYAGSGGFTAFFRRYTKTWLHGVSTAALTAFGALAVLHRGFVAVAIAAYVLPPIVMYVAGSGPAAEPIDDPSSETSEPTGDAHGTSADEPTLETGGLATGQADERTTAASSRIEPDERSTGSNTAVDADTEAATTTDTETDTDTDSYSDSDSESPPEAHWRPIDAPTGATLNDVAIADGDGYAVGDGGVVLADGGGGWRTVLSDGPGAAAETLRGVDATDDGGALWIAGDGGTVARIDADADRHVDFTPPMGRTDNVTDVAAAGPTDDEVVLLVNGSGEVLRGRYREGDLAWDEPVKPGSGSSLAGVALADASTGYCCDTNDGVFETTDGGESFRQIGVGSAGGTLTDVATVGRGDCTVSADDGVLHRHDDGNWTPVRLGDEELDAIALADGRGVACGARAVYARDGPNGDWERSATAAPGALGGVAVDRSRAIAVGSEGAILERA